METDANEISDEFDDVIFIGKISDSQSDVTLESEKSTRVDSNNQNNEKHFDDIEIIFCKKKNDIETIEIEHDEVLENLNQLNSSNCVFSSADNDKNCENRTSSGSSETQQMSIDHDNSSEHELQILPILENNIVETNNSVTSNSSVSEIRNETENLTDDVIFDCAYIKPIRPDIEYRTIAAIDVNNENNENNSKPDLRNTSVFDITQKMLPSSIPGLATLYVANEHLLPLNIRPSQTCYYFQINSNIEIMSISKQGYYKIKNQMIKPNKTSNRHRYNHNYKQEIPRLCYQVKKHSPILMRNSAAASWPHKNDDRKPKLTSRKNISIRKSNWNGFCFASVREWLNSKIDDPVHRPFKFKIKAEEDPSVLFIKTESEKIKDEPL